MQIGAVRSGLVEARHDVACAAVDASGRVIFAEGPGDDRQFFYRSAAKPFQAAEVQASGAGLAAEELAVAASSHGGHPVHVAYVRVLLSRAGLSEEDLVCPPAWPMSSAAMRGLAAAGEREPRRVFHNCSGKHAGMLTACVASGWSLAYSDPDHPLQERILARMADVTGEDPGPVGVDGCGVPVFRGTVVGLARAFSRLAVDHEYDAVRVAATRFTALTADADRVEAKLARWVPSVVKGGAVGCIGLAWQGGIGVAAKSWTGDVSAAAIGVVEALERLDLLPDHPARMLAEVARPPVFGGSEVVGHLEPV